MGWPLEQQTPADVETEMVTRVAALMPTLTVSTKMPAPDAASHVMLTLIGTRQDRPVRQVASLAVQVSAPSKEAAWDATAELIGNLGSIPDGTGQITRVRLTSGPSWIPSGYGTTDEVARYALNLDVTAAPVA